MLEIIIRILLVIICILELYILLHAEYDFHKQRKKNQAFWDEVHKKIDNDIKELLNENNMKKGETKNDNE